METPFSLINQVLARLVDTQHLIAKGPAALMHDALLGQMPVPPATLRILKPPKRAAELRNLEFGRVKIFYICYGADVLVSPVTFKEHYCIDMPLRGRAWMRSDGFDLIAETGEITVTSPGKAVSYMQEADCGIITVLIPQSLVDAELVRLLGGRPSNPLYFEPWVNLNTGNGRSWVGTLVAICLQLGDPESLLSRGMLIAEAEQWLLATLLTALPHTYSQALSTQKSGKYFPHYLHVIERLVCERLTQNINVDDLVAASGMSRRSLFAVFRKYLHASPMGYIRSRRLEAARQDLLRADPALASVTEIAGRWGFGNLGNFSVAYRRTYGETPSNTLRRTVI